MNVHCRVNKSKFAGQGQVVGGASAAATDASTSREERAKAAEARLAGQGA